MRLYDGILFAAHLLAALKKPHHFSRLFALPPQIEAREVIWFHAVSVGEVKSARPLIETLRPLFPEAFFLMTTVTATGLEEAKRSLRCVDRVAYAPVDRSKLAYRWARQLSPRFFFAIEGDLWPNILSALKRQGTKNILVSGKMSARSERRLALFPRFARKLFEPLDMLCVQNEQYAARFSRFVSAERVKVCGNLKRDQKPEFVETHPWKEAMKGWVVTLACTHRGEEEMLLDAINWDRCSIFLAPRHPERFEAVAKILRMKNIPFIRFSRFTERCGHERAVLVDAMGQLPLCYNLSQLAVLGGSFIPGIGGHNLLEPILYGVPVFFGNYTEQQKEMVQNIVEAKAGKQISCDRLREEIDAFCNTPSHAESMRQSAISLMASQRGAVRATLEAFHELA